MTKPRVVVTDYTFPDLDRERAAAAAAGADFEAFQCKTADEVREADGGSSLGAAETAALGGEGP